MADSNIVIKITSETNLNETQKQIEEFTSKAYDLEKQLSALKKAEKEEIDELEKRVKASQIAVDSANEMIAALEKEGKDTSAYVSQLEKSTKKLAENSKKLDEAKAKHKALIIEKKNEIEANKKSIKTLNDAVKSYKTMQGSMGKAAQKLRAMREELMRMEDAGQYGTQAFVDLSIKAAKLEDQMGDLQQRIRILASDTKNMDAVMGLGDGLAGGFYIATSTAELFGGELEGLQQAFYKVQAVMSIVSGYQQIYNALQKDSQFATVVNTALTKLFSKEKQKSAITTKLDADASNKDALAKVKNAGATEGATVAQKGLNAAFKANPIGFVIASLLALFALVAAGIALYQRFLTARGKAAAELERLQAENGANEAQRAYDRQEQIKATDDAEQKALTAAKKRYASEVEMAQIKAKFAKQRAEETKAYNDAEIERNNKEVEQLKILMDAKQKEADEASNIFGRKKRKQKELAEATQAYYDALQKTTDMEHESADAAKASADANQELIEARKQMALEAEQVNVALMQEGATKEIAQIKLNYREKLKELKGNSKEEIALRKALLEQEAKEIQAVQDKYAQQARQTAIQNQKNLLTQMSQSQGKEKDYQAQLQMQKDILKAEADDQIKALEESVARREISEEDAKAKIEAVRLQLNADLANIDEQDYKRTEEVSKRRTSILIKEAENAANALRGDEPVEQQLETWDNYYQARQKQIEDNAQFEIDEAKRAASRGEITAEQLADREKEIEANKQADLTALAKDGAQKRVDVQSQALTDLEIAVAQAEDKVSKAQTGGQKIDALKEQLKAEKALYAKQRELLKEEWDSGALKDWGEYKKRQWEITKATADAEVEYQQNAIQAVTESFQTALNYMQQISDLAFDALGSQVQAELDALEEGYTTDWEEAQKSANKKYLTEKEYNKKKAALEEKQAKYQKTQALISAAINTALAITNALNAPPPASFVFAAIAAAMGAAQIGIIASKPLAQYAKGRKGGKGEYALVGEKGAELMYVPKGASIIPHDKIADQEAWGRYGVPRFDMPDMPVVNADSMRFVTTTPDGRLTIDYDKLGEAVARNIPQQKAVTVNVDRSGVHVTDGANVHTYLNSKYNGAWR